MSKTNCLAARSALFASVALTAAVSLGQQDRWVEPIVRVAHEEPADQRQPAQVASRVVPGGAPTAAFDLTQRPGEHPLAPALRIAQASLADIDRNIRDYSAIVYKQERIDGELMDQEVAFVKVRHQPFSVYMFFLAPNKGRECLYSEGPAGTNGKLLARDCGFRRKLGVFELDPTGRLAMKGQKYPITKLGVKALTDELVTVASNDVKFGECEVKHLQTELGPKTGPKRPVTMLEVTHPIERIGTFRFHKARVYIDDELRIPIRYEAYLWPRGNEAPPLEETYTYMNLKVNNGFTDADFDRKNPEYFKD
ncbi:MAG: DUF1571 domain-containing protein [Pirellulales bacterium]|nr:DUF1571 domain-containing protein [Pirellulales bacterium]